MGPRVRSCLARLLVAMVTVLSFAALPAARLAAGPAQRPVLDPTPPARPVKLVFVHHSTGGNWLADPNDDQPYGGLGAALRDNNYFVSATNYGWGPGGIGDRTDIPNWPEWFAGPNSGAILDALYGESEQNVGGFGGWPRLATDPGGENEVVMFKSCFPNSDLYGSPSDPPAAALSDQYTVANAKAVYNRLLAYFETRPDKLFVVITAPPLAEFDYTRDAQSPASRAANARAFNNWLVYEWLSGYPHANVAVFDYYNALTSNGGSPEVSDVGAASGNHHRWRNGAIEHVQGTDNDYSSYPSGDSHPSTAGHSKATDEFVPLLNVYYNRWQRGAPALPLPTPAPAQPEAPAPTPEAAPGGGATGAAVSGAVIADWEAGSSWACYDEGQGSRVVWERDTGVAHGGTASLRIAYDIVAEGWGDCDLSFEDPQDWSGADGLAMWLRAGAESEIGIALFSGAGESSAPFFAYHEIDAGSQGEWRRVVLPWARFSRPEWADEGGPAELEPERIIGLGLAFDPGEGTLWVDDVVLYSAADSPPEAQQMGPAAEEQSQPEPEPPAALGAEEPPPEDREVFGRALPCASSGALFWLAALLWLLRRR